MNDSGHRAFRVDPHGLHRHQPSAPRRPRNRVRAGTAGPDLWDALDPDWVRVPSRAPRTELPSARAPTPEFLVAWRCCANGAAGRRRCPGARAPSRRRTNVSWREVALNAQVSAIAFYLRHGFQPLRRTLLGSGHRTPGDAPRPDRADRLEDPATRRSRPSGAGRRRARGLSLTAATWTRGCSMRRAWSRPSAASPSAAAATKCA